MKTKPRITRLPAAGRGGTDFLTANFADYRELYCVNSLVKIRDISGLYS
jgi:hypothetical protein